VSGRTVAVLGTVNRDEIVTPDGDVRRSLGGILYNVFPLAALLEGTGARILPIGRLGAEDREEAAGLIGPLPGVDPAGLLVDPAGTNLSRLDYSGGGERRESVRMQVAPLSAEDVAPAADADVVVVNLISGRDLAVETVEALRRETDARPGGGALFCLDVQALARTTDTPRRPRADPAWERWAAAFHVVRGNEDEISWVAGTEGREEPAVERLLRAGAREVIVTRGMRGSTRAVLADGAVRSARIPAWPVAREVDPTGCGDAFLAGLVAGRVLGLGPDDSCHLGAFTASEVVGLSGLGALGALRGIRERARAAHPRLAALPA
jgi:sugar/nucleoside kinase (ribokinase family)